VLTLLRFLVGVGVHIGIPREFIILKKFRACKLVVHLYSHSDRPQQHS
jgi:hypothetical protein